MIIPSIDIQDGGAVQLRHGRDLVLDGGDPLMRLEQFGVAGEVAVVDLDAAMRSGSNRGIVEDLVRRHPVRVGGGIRDLDTARRWLDAGAARLVIGTAATPAFLSALPRERVMAAVDADRGEVVVDGWRERTRDHVLDRIRDLAPFVGGFLLTQVDKEGAMGGFDLDLIRRAVDAADGVPITAAGGITTAGEIATLDAMGVDAQVGMALYTDHLTLGDAVAAVLTKPLPGEIWPTVVSDVSGETLGLVWSNRATVAEAVNARQGIYWSRSRGSRWVKGETSGNTQQLVRVHVDCDRDALEFVVRQSGAGFCHTGRRSCFDDDFTFATLERTIRDRVADGDPASGTVKLVADPALLTAKLREEAGELGAAATQEEAIHEAADLLYFALVAMARGDVALADVRRELARRHGRTTRRPMKAKPPSQQ